LYVLKGLLMMKMLPMLMVPLTQQEIWKLFWKNWDLKMLSISGQDM